MPHLRSLCLAALCLLPAACGDDDDSAPGIDAGEAEVDGGASLQPPAPGPAAAVDGEGETMFVLRKWQIGDTRRDGTLDRDNGWKEFGYDLDHRASTATSTGLCTPLNDADPAKVQPDGIDGTDNAFGKLIVPILTELQADLGAQLDDDLAESGRGALLFSLQGLGSAADYNPIDTRVYRPVPGDAPAFDGNDVFGVDAASITGVELSTARLIFTDGYLVGNTWVGRSDDQPLEIHWELAGQILVLTVHHPIVSMDLDAAHTGAVNGTIAGILDAGELGEAFRAIAGGFDPSLCSGVAIDSIITQLEQAADILLDGSQDPGKPCEGISIGLGFTAVRAAVSTISEVPATPPACD